MSADIFEIRESLDRYAASLNLEYPRWLCGDKADEGLTYCRECAEKALAEGLGEYLGGGFAQECDTYEQCYTCSKMLEYHLSEHGAEREFDWLKYKRFKKIDKETAYMVARILEVDLHNKKYIRLAQRALAGIPTALGGKSEQNTVQNSPMGITVNTSPLERGFEVEWLTDVPLNEFGDADIDRGKTNTVDFASIEDALGHARKVMPLDFYGAPIITEFEMVPYVAGKPGTYREYIGQAQGVDE
jgi:hypothetical protein